MDYSVSLSLQSRRALTQRALTAVAAVGGCASGSIRGKLLGTNLTVTASSSRSAALKASAIVKRLVPGRVLEIETLTVREADRRFKAWSAAAKPPRSDPLQA